jgi:hypothetical protein
LRPALTDRQQLRHTGRPVGLQVAARDQLVAEEERQHVVAVHPLRRRHVDLEPVVHPEQCRGAVALPEE